ncbi:MAG: GNAT family N-acetyltransferase [Phyllobacteriaceae bacterium]|nr:GNAT family N-acetyltransferase [Phyllobacteriaceae bacterium]
MTILMTSLKDRLPTSLRTERLVMTTPTLADAPAMAALANNKGVHRWMSRLPYPYSLADAEYFITQVVPSPEEYCLALHTSDGLIGVIGLHFAPGRVPDLGYWLGEPYWGLGYGSEAAIAIVEACRTAGATAIRARAMRDNEASRKVLRKAGFIENGDIIDESVHHPDGVVMVLAYQELRQR